MRSSFKGRAQASYVHLVTAGWAGGVPAQVSGAGALLSLSAHHGQVLNFGFVPVKYQVWDSAYHVDEWLTGWQVLFSNFVGLAWNIYLSMVAHK